MESGSFVELIDFSAESPPNRLSYVERIAHAGIAISCCRVSSNSGTMFDATQFVVTIHKGDPIEMEWRPLEKGPMEQCRIVAGDQHVNPADRPLFLRWTDSPRLLVIGMERRFIEQVVSDAFDGSGLALRTAVGIRDPVIEGMAAAWGREQSDRTAGGGLCIEELGSALADHLVRTHSDGLNWGPPVIGGLGTRRLRRVVDYIDAHLAEDISLRDLAALAGLSPHHFGEFFKVSTGMPAHRYVIERPIRRAKERLLAGDQSIAQIAVTLGFAGRRRFAQHLRKLTGTTPSRIRLERN